MTGSEAERRLLGALILDARNHEAAAERVSADDFSDARLGAVFTGIGLLAAMGRTVGNFEVENEFPTWGVKGFQPSETFDWTSDAHSWDWAPAAAAVRTASVRRSLDEITQVIAEQVRGGDSPLDVASRAAERLRNVIDGASSGKLATKTLEEILQGSDEYDWIIPGLLERKDRLILTGGEGSGKTTFVRQLAVAAASGIHPISFRPIDPVRVLVVDAENTERQWRRAVRWTVEQAQRFGVNPAPLINIKAGERIDITRGSHLSEIHRLIDQHKPDILFIGPLYKLVPGAINNDDDAAPLIVGLDSLRERDIALVMEAHAGKGSAMDGERDLRPRGSSALLGWPEFGMGLRPIPEDPDMVKVVRWRGDRDSRDWPRYLRRGGDWPWTAVRGDL